MSKAELEAAVLVQGGRERGLILHKLMEEVLTGETQESEAAIAERAAELIRALGKVPRRGSGGRAFCQRVGRLRRAHSGIAGDRGLRPELLAEFPVYALRGEGSELVATAGIADALTIGSRRPTGRGRRLEERREPRSSDARPLSSSGPRLSRHDRRRARTDCSDDHGNGDRRLALAADGGGLTGEPRWHHASAPPAQTQDDLFNPEVDSLLSASPCC